MDDIDTSPDWLKSTDYDDEPEVDQDEAPDKNALSHILLTALREIDELGGRQRHTLAQTLGRSNYDTLMQKPAVAKAIDTWVEASPKTKPAAAKILAVRIAQVADEPKLVARIENELRDAAVDYFDTGRSSETQVKAPTTTQVPNHRQALNQRRNGQRVAYEAPKGTDLHMLAKLDDGRRYIEARRRQQKETRR
jgi:hypothetical protein